MTQNEQGHWVKNESTRPTTTTYSVKFVCDNCGTPQITLDAIPPPACNQCGMLFIGVRKQ